MSVNLTKRKAMIMSVHQLFFKIAQYYIGMPDKKIEPSDPSERHMSNDLLESLRLKEQMDAAKAASDEKENEESLFARVKFRPSLPKKKGGARSRNKRSRSKRSRSKRSRSKRRSTSERSRSKRNS